MSLHPARSEQSDAAPPAEVVDAVDIDEWQETADRCPYATFFQTPAWYLAFAKSDPSLRIATRRFSFADGATAILPLMERRVRSLGPTRYLMGPAGCYGGWISADPLAPGHLTTMVDWVFQNCPRLIWRLNPLDEHPSWLNDRCTTPDSTELLPIGEFKDEATLRQSYKRSVRKEIGKAQRAGFTMSVAEEWPEWEAYYRLYEQALERWGDKATSRYPLALFAELFALRSSGIRLWILKRDKDVIGGNLNFYQGRHCVEWHAAFDSRFFGSGGRNLLVHSIIVDAMAEGYAIYDFNPSGGHEGTRAFKRSFGTREVPANLIDTSGKSSLLAAAARLAGIAR